MDRLTQSPNKTQTRSKKTLTNIQQCGVQQLLTRCLVSKQQLRHQQYMSFNL